MAARFALVLLHVPFEGLAGLAAPIGEAGYAIRYLDLGREPVAGPAIRDADLVVAMGGPMGVYEVDAHPWIADEVAALRSRIALRRPTLGICLGAQMIAAALGARVHAGPVREVGFAPVTLTDAGAASPLAALAGVPLLHWHGDTFELPAGTELLASSICYRHQAFRIGDWLLAIQFHPEMGDDPCFERWLDGADDYVGEAGTTPDTLRADHRALGPAAVAAGREAVAAWLAEAGLAEAVPAEVAMPSGGGSVLA